MGDFWDYKTFIRERWHKPSALFAALLVTTATLLTTVRFDTSSMNKVFWGFAVVVWLTTIIAWLSYRRYHRCPEGRIGVVFAIQDEDYQRYEKLKYHFIDPIKQSLDQRIYHVQVLPYFRCKEVSDKETAINYLGLTCSHMIIYGRCRAGNIQGEEAFEVNLNSLILHAKITEEKQKLLQTELSELIPRVYINKKDDLTEYALTSQWLAIYTRYFIGVASLVSRNLDHAQQIFEDLKDELTTFRVNVKAVNTIKKRINDELIGIYADRCAYNYGHLFRNSKDMEYVEEAYQYLLKVNSMKADTPFYFNMLAIFEFLRNRNIAKSRGLLRRLGDRDAAKHYSLAFLEAYEGNLTKALQHYKRAFRLNQNPDMSIEIEEFIDYIIQLELDKYHLYLCLALINQFKGDYKLAKLDLERFNQMCTNAIRHKAIAQKIAVELELKNSEVAASCEAM
ncbi:tetratricopeptide repeat protein [Robertmurraya sp.]|uniref:tetratricopeptide repeat protein n=1 Tax=Robertmurraya sp. TaxID=2837525 RepID=UPI003703E134